MSEKSIEWHKIKPETIGGVDKNFYVSKCGLVKMLRGNITKGSLNNRGYYIVSLSGAGVYCVHVLVAETFLSRPVGFKTEVNHKDCCKTNNHIDNLEFVTSSENKRHAVQNNLLKSEKPVQCIKVNTTEVVAVYRSIREAARVVKAQPSHIISCCKNRLKSTKGFCWKYQAERSPSS